MPDRLGHNPESHIHTSDIRYTYIDGSTFRRKKVFYSAVNGLAIFEGDIILGTVERMETIRDAVDSGTAATRGIVHSDSGRRWPDGLIPYCIHPKLPQKERVAAAIRHISQFTNLRFRERTNEANFVEFKDGEGCSAPVGMEGGGQAITIGIGCDWPRVAHEICHAAGLWHEQSRGDRDKFVTIQWDNITETEKHNFCQHIADGDDVGSYDYDSLMHYEHNAFAIDKTKDTITPTPDPKRAIGQRVGLSRGDIEAINSIYPGVMRWNLADSVASIESGRRGFYPPLACVPPTENTSLDWSVTVGLQSKAFDTFTEVNTEPNAQAGAVKTTTDVRFDIYINLPAGSSHENDLPSPQIRVHAVDKGLLYYRAKSATSAIPYLELILQSFQTGYPPVPWFDRWVEAGCIPSQLLYHNIDDAVMRELLNRIPLPNENPGSYFGTAFPKSVNSQNKVAYINDVLNGRKPILVKAGAYIGAAAPLGRPEDNRHALGLSARYAAGSSADILPMNPRELLNLLFGDDSAEATTHPLLKAINAFAKSQTVQPETRRFTLRPPLRTWRRVVWEADLEISNHSADWGVKGALGPARLHNGQRANFDNITYQGLYKCNLFASDICLRSGFRIATHPIRGNTAKWHYIDASSYANFAHASIEQDAKSERVPLLGLGESKAHPWGWALDNWMRSSSRMSFGKAIDIQFALNRLMEVEGRCLVMPCARTPNHSGHILIVKKVLSQPKLTDRTQNDVYAPGHTQLGLAGITVEAIQAGEMGAAITTSSPKLHGKAGTADAEKGYIRLHLIELHPGKDPDTLQGLADLNVHHAICNPIERARSALNKVRHTRSLNNPDHQTGNGIARTHTSRGANRKREVANARS